jgi:hypothetical protein
MGAQIIQNHMEFLARMERHETVHKIKELDPSLAFEMASSDLPCGHIQCRKQGARSVAFV